MSMEKEYTVHETHSRSITALGLSPARREIYLGFEDGIVKSIELDTGTKLQTYNEHKGWITAFLYWPTTKLLFCSSNDSVISVIGAGGNLMDKVFIGVPVYSMALNSRRKEIILGVTNGLQFHEIFETKEGFSHYIEARPTCVIREHTDIVRCVTVIDSRIYSSGYDGALVIYDCHFTGKQSAVKSFKNPRAHDAGISCLSVEKDAVENNIWIFTGGFDRSLKIWTGDGKIVHRFDGFLTGVTGTCYIPKNKTIICLVGTNAAFIYDPKSGEDVTDFIDTFSEEAVSNYNLQLLKYLNEFNYMLATTSRRQLLVYKYNPSGCLTSLKYNQPLDGICYTSKVPILIFTGDSNGSVCKWEQQQLNQLIYASESLLKSELVQKESSKIQGQIPIKKSNQNNDSSNNQDSSSIDAENNNQATPIKRTNIILKMVFIECLDLLLAASEDGNIYVWGFDQEAVKILKNMKYTEDKEKLQESNLDYFQTYLKNIRRVREVIIDDAENEQDELAKASNKLETDSVTNRVAGFILKKILSEHSSCVTSLIVVDRLDLYPNRYLLSAGWDRRICIWDLDKLRLYDLFRNKNVNSYEEVELASDGNILDMCYCEKYNQFAYASTDSMVYIRKFSNYGSEMTLVNTLQGHLNEVNCVKWIDKKEVWVTGGEDTTVRIWSKNCECLEVIVNNGPINTICYDPVEHVIMVACHDVIKVFDMDDYHLVQQNTGHHDSIRDLIFIPERNHIVSVSWDRTIKVWKGYRKLNLYHKKNEKDSEKKFETWVWDQMKIALKNENSFSIENYSDFLSLERK